MWNLMRCVWELLTGAPAGMPVGRPKAPDGSRVAPPCESYDLDDQDDGDEIDVAEWDG